MEPKDYVVDEIRGEYAILKSTTDDGEIFVAIAILPPDTDVGTKLHYEMFQYSVI